MKITWLVISVILNLILISSLFFKSALNNILEEWWKEKQKRKNEQKDRLLELKSTLSELSPIISTLPVNIVTLLKGNFPDDNDRKKIDDLYKKDLDTYGKAIKIIVANEIYYPDDIRTSLPSLKDIIENGLIGLYKEDFTIFVKFDEMSSNISTMIKKIDSYLIKSGLVKKSGK